MKRRLLTAAALAAATLTASMANAAVAISWGAPQNDPDTLPGNQVLIADFDGGVNSTATLVPWATLTLQGATIDVNEGGSGYSGTLPGPRYHYLTVPGNTTATFTFTRAINSFSLYMGSPDTYNTISFYNGQTLVDFADGNAIFQFNTNQNWDYARRVNFTLTSPGVNRIVLGSGANSFEVDNAAAGVPEPAAWALMIGGFGAAGAMLRRRRVVA